MNDYSYHTVSSIINAFQKSVNFPFKIRLSFMIRVKAFTATTLTTVKGILSVTMATLRLEMKMVKLCLQWQPRGIIDNN